MDELVKEADTEKEGYVNYEGRKARIRSSKNNPDPDPTIKFTPNLLSLNYISLLNLGFGQ